MAETKKCEVCEQEIGANETKCPKCGTDFAELEDEVKVVTRAQTVAEKRKKAAAPVAPEVTTPVKRSIFKSLATPKG